MLYAIFFHIFMSSFLLLEHMGFYLVYHRFSFSKLAQVNEPVRVEVGHPDGPELSCLVGFLHRPVSAVVVPKGLMNQHQVQIVRFHPLQGLVDRGFRFFITGVGHPDFTGEEQFLAGHTGFLNGTAHCLLISIGLCRIDGAVPHRKGIQYTALALFI